MVFFVSLLVRLGFVLCFFVWFDGLCGLFLWGFFLFLGVVAVFARFWGFLLLCFLHKVIYLVVLIMYLTCGLRALGFSEV